MNTTSLVGRLARLQQVIVVSVVVLFSASALWCVARTFEQQDDLELRKAADHIAANLVREWEEEPDLTLKAGAEAALEEEGDRGVSFEIRDERGTVLAATPVSDSMKTMRRAMVVAGIRGLSVIASKSTQASRRALAAMAIAFTLVGVPIVLAGFALSQALARRALRPLSRMTLAADEASRSGTPLTLAAAGDPEEVARLGSAFDRLISQLSARAESERRFAEDAAHELRTPLTGLSGELELAIASLDTHPEARAGLLRAGEQARVLRELVDALLLLRRAEQGILDHAHLREAVNLADVAREVVDASLKPHPDRRADLLIDCADEVLVRGQPALLSAAVRNLVANALQFTRPGQRVSVSVHQRAEEAVVRVEDAGPGVAPADRERIFDPFFRSAVARASHEGSGLGLPILRRVARAHHGDVRLVESQLGGAAFEVRIPLWGARGGAGS